MLHTFKSCDLFFIFLTFIYYKIATDCHHGKISKKWISPGILDFGPLRFVLILIQCTIYTNCKFYNHYSYKKADKVNPILHGGGARKGGSIKSLC